jgi:membrane fusion protein, heavy metal efflux system
MKVKLLLIMTVGALAVFSITALRVQDSGGSNLYAESETTTPHDTETCACCDPNQGGNESAEHQHDEHSPGDVGHSHGEVDQSGPSGGEHEHEGIQLDEQQRKKFAIEVGRVTAGALDRSVRVPGEVKLNADRVAHIVPTAQGIVRQVLKSVGDPVQPGEIIAWLESAQLGQAKVTYLGHVFELTCCSIELTRAQEIHDNTIKLLDMLKSNPSLESLQKLNGSAMGANRSDLIAAYAEYTFAQKAYEREKQLLEKQITSEQDYLKAESSFKKADALYAAVRDRIAFDIQRNLLEARRARQVREMDLMSSERQLYVLGLTAKDIHPLKELAQNQKSGPENGKVCTDPNCKDCAQHKGDIPAAAPQNRSMMTERLAWYPLRAPFAGTILTKHITLGEMVPADAMVFVIADLRTIWVDLQVHLNELSSIKNGQPVTISAGGRLPKAQDAIDYLDPTINPKTRTALARIVLPNPSGTWRPGLFVSADITLEKTSTNPTVDKSSIQYLEDKPCVFVLHGGQFEPRFLTLGRSNPRYVEIVSGLEAGETIVTKNSFRLKAEFMKRTMGDIGHGHAH